MTTKYEVTIKFLVEDDVPEDELNQFLGELQAPADDPSADVHVYSVSVNWAPAGVWVPVSGDRPAGSGVSAHGRVIPAELA